MLLCFVAQVDIVNLEFHSDYKSKRMQLQIYVQIYSNSVLLPSFLEKNNNQKLQISKINGNSALKWTASTCLASLDSQSTQFQPGLCMGMTQH